MGKNKYNVEVTDEKKETKKYKVVINETNSILKKDATYKPYTSIKVMLIIIFLILISTAIGVVYIGCNKIKGCKNNAQNYIMNNNVNLEMQNLDNIPENIFIKVITSVKYNLSNRSLCIYCILLASFILTVITVIICISLIIVKDDGGIRFAKLNELHNLRNSVLLNFSDKEKIKNIKEIETDQIKFPIKNDEKKQDGSNININYNLPLMESTKEKNLYSEFLKNYMNAIVEI